MSLGHLVWWRVADTSMDADTATAVAEKLDIKPPIRPAPVDVFRKLAGTDYARRQGHTTERLQLHPAESQHTMLVRHIVKHVYRNGVPQAHDRVGEAVFYKPPRQQPSKARLRVTMNDPNDEWLAPYGDKLRAEYAHGLTRFDEQGVRRLVRAYLNRVHALLVDGVYFLREQEHADNMMWLFEQLGGDCRCHCVTVDKGSELQPMLEAALERAVADGSKLDLLEAYIPLGVVPDSLWEQLETES